jgi:hypothetical protein
MSGFDSTAIERAFVHRPIFKAYAKSLRWAYGGPPEFVRLANERALAVPDRVEAAATIG